VFPPSSGLGSLFFILCLAWLLIVAMSFVGGLVGLSLWLTRPTLANDERAPAALTWIAVAASLLLVATVVEIMWMGILVLRAASNPSLLTEMDRTTNVVFHAPVAQLPIAFAVLVYAVYRRRPRRG
jgi:hypothetical protein